MGLPLGWRPETPKELTLGELFDMYLDEVTPRNSTRHQRYDRVASDMFKRYFGTDRVVSTLNRRDWDAFTRDRGEGRAGPGKGRWSPVGARTVQKDLSFLRSVLRWATTAGDGQGQFLLAQDPLRGCPLPKEKNPRRVTLSEEEYQALLAVAPELDWRFHVALVLTHETGHRIGAVREIRWRDVDLAQGRMTWRAEHEKTGREHVTPMTPLARVAFETARKRAPGIGEAPVLPSPKDAAKPVGRYLVRGWWRKAERLVGLERRPGRGWHSLRRKFATDLMHEPLKVLCMLGGWKDAETVLTCYQRPDEDRLRAALEGRPRGPRTGPIGSTNRHIRT